MPASQERPEASQAAPEGPSSTPAERPQAPQGDAQEEGLVQFGDELADAADQADLSAQLSALQEEVAQYHDRLLRAHAELDNARRRAQEDVAKARKFGIESFAESLIPVRDSLEAALSQPDQEAAAWREGVEVTLRQLNGAFERNQLVEISPDAGERFDPHRHQAIASVPSDEQPEGAVIQRLQKGYALADRVMRPALVTVSAGPGAA